MVVVVAYKSEVGLSMSAAILLQLIVHCSARTSNASQFHFSASSSVYGHATVVCHCCCVLLRQIYCGLFLKGDDSEQGCES
jgi:hypothetical protein